MRFSPKLANPAFLALAVLLCVGAAPEKTEEGFLSLFDGKDLSQWLIPKDDNGHWKVENGVIDYDAKSESPAANCV